MKLEDRIAMQIGNLVIQGENLAAQLEQAQATIDGLTKKIDELSPPPDAEVEQGEKS